MTKLLVLGGSFQHCKVVEAAKRSGIKVYVTDYLAHSPAKKVADVELMYDVKDIDEIVKYCKKEGISAVINTSLDPCQIPYQLIAEQLDIPCFGDKNQFFQLTNKNAFKKLCEKHNVDIIESYQIEDVVHHTIDASEFPLFVKPVDSRGSRGQSICNSYEQLASAIQLAQNESSNGDVVIEKYMEECYDFTVAYLIQDGVPKLVRTGDRYLGSKDEKMDKVCIASVSPSKFTKMYLDNVHSKVVSMIKALGICNGPFFMQGFVDGETIRFYDPGFRFSGGEYERLLSLATGIDLIEELVCYAVSGKMKSNIPDDLYLLGGKQLVQLCPTVRAGQIGEIIGKEEILDNENVISFSCRYELGEIVADKNDVTRRFAEICILTNSDDEERMLLSYIQNTLKIVDTNGNDMICDKLDLKLLYNNFSES